MMQAALEERDGVAIREDRIAANRDLILRMSGATDGERKQQEKRIAKIEVDICKLVDHRAASPSLLDFTLELINHVHQLATYDNAEIAAETRSQTQAWESAMSTLSRSSFRTCHSLVSGMLIELALMHLPKIIYKINSVVVGVITACLAMQRFPSEPMRHVLREHLTRIGLQFIANECERQLCETFQEKLLEVWRRPGQPCAVMRKWMGRAEKNNFDALKAVAPPAIAEPATSLQRKRIHGKTSFTSLALQNGLSPIKSGKKNPSSARAGRRNNYVPVAKKRSGGIRAGAGRRRQRVEQ